MTTIGTWEGKRAAVDVPVITYPRTDLLFLGTSSGTKARSLTPHCRCWLVFKFVQLSHGYGGDSVLLWGWLESLMLHHTIRDKGGPIALHGGDESARTCGWILPGRRTRSSSYWRQKLLQLSVIFLTLIIFTTDPGNQASITWLNLLFSTRFSFRSFEVPE